MRTRCHNFLEMANFQHVCTMEWIVVFCYGLLSFCNVLLKPCCKKHVIVHVCFHSWPKNCYGKKMQKRDVLVFWAQFDAKDAFHRSAVLVIYNVIAHLYDTFIHGLEFAVYILCLVVAAKILIIYLLQD